MGLKRIFSTISLSLSLLLLYASGIKFWDYFNSNIGFDFFPFVKDFHVPLFWGLIIIQLLLPMLLLYRKTRLFGLYCIFFLFTSLSTYLYAMLHYADHVPCFCTGIVPGLSWEGHLWFTVALTVMAGGNIVLSPEDIHARG